MQQARPELLAAFGSTLWVKGLVVIPNLLLMHYARLGLNEAEVMLLLHLLRLEALEGNCFPQPEEISRFMSVDAAKVRELMASLMEKKVLKVVQTLEPSGKRSFRYCWQDFMVRLAEIWLGEHREAAAAAEEGDTKLGEVYASFEREFGRPLSPFESAQLGEWCQRHPVELVHEALRLAVLRGVYNFRYIDSILREWEKNNVRTLREAQEHEARFRERRTRKRRAREADSSDGGTWKDEKYKDLYLS